jgi:hypothetical protein
MKAHPLIAHDLEIWLRQRFFRMQIYLHFEMRVPKSMLKTASECIALGYADPSRMGGGHG